MTAHLPAASAASAVGIGSRVIYRDETADDTEEVTIVTHLEADCGNNLISAESPVGRALLDHRVGDRVRVSTPGGIRVLNVLAVEIGV